MKNCYNADYRLLMRWLTPPMLCQDAFDALLQASAEPLCRIQDDFIGYVESATPRAGGQTCYLQSLLNKHFDPLLQRVRVRTLEKPASGILYRRSAKRPLRVPTLVTRRGYSGVTHPDFAIVLPYGFTLSPSEESRLRALVNQNKLASKKYIIINE